MPTLILDIETVGEKFDDMDESTQQALTAWIGREADDDDEKHRLTSQVKEGLGFSPLTGKIITLGVLDLEKNKGTVYYSTQNSEHKAQTEDNFSFKPASEKEMLESFWAGAKQYDTFVTFNGRSFDIPFIMVRSAVHGVRPTKNLMSNRYLSMQRGGYHVDLYDQLSFYGAVRRPGSLHLWTRAFGIKSPKEDGITGYDVARLYHEGHHLDIAKYNANDLTATAQLYQRWEKYLSF